jgi:nucleotide-binding universal stress UspA family protein
MIKSILTAIDGSPASLAGLREAVKWAELLGADLRVIFVEDEERFVYYPAISSFEGGMAVPITLPEEDLVKENAKVRAETDAVRKDLDAALKGKRVKASFSSPRGNINELLISEARQVDLVVMGRRGKNDPPGSTKPGPTTETLIQDALRPVLVVPAQGRSSGPVLFAYDGSKGINRVLPVGTFLAEQAKLQAAVITVDDDARKCDALHHMVKRYLAPHGIEPKLIKQRGKAMAHIVAASEQERAGLIVMGAFGQSPIRQLFFGSTTLEVLEKANCPVLLMA